MDIMKVMEKLYKDEEKDTDWPKYSTEPCYHAKGKTWYEVKDEQLDLFDDREEGLTFRQRMHIEK